MLQLGLDFGAIVLADLVLSGDNALIIGMAAASLIPTRASCPCWAPLPSRLFNTG